MSNTTVVTNQYVHVYGGILRPLDPSLPAVEVRTEPVSIGRGSSCGLVLVNDKKKVSTLHAEPNGNRETSRRGEGLQSPAPTVGC